MKNKLYILICLLSISFAGCNNWLDVRPDTERELNDMFADQQGFQDALIGGYLKMKSTSAYGQTLMYGNIEYLAQHWDYTSESTQEKISRYNYQDSGVQGVFEGIYSPLRFFSSLQTHFRFHSMGKRGLESGFSVFSMSSRGMQAGNSPDSGG